MAAVVTLVVTFLNRPSRLFHSLVEGVAANGAHLIVLGYGTRIADKIKDKLMLQAGLKIVAAHAFFVPCKTSLPPSKVVIFLDGSDTVLERTTHTAPRAHSGPPSTQWPTERLAPRALGPASNASAVPAQVLQLPAAEVVSRYRAFHRGQLVVSTEPGTFWASDAEKAAYRRRPASSNTHQLARRLLARQLGRRALAPPDAGECVLPRRPLPCERALRRQPASRHQHGGLCGHSERPAPRFPRHDQRRG